MILRALFLKMTNTIVIKTSASKFPIYIHVLTNEDRREEPAVVAFLSRGSILRTCVGEASQSFQPNRLARTAHTKRALLAHTIPWRTVLDGHRLSPAEFFILRLCGSFPPSPPSLRPSFSPSSFLTVPLFLPPSLPQAAMKTISACGIPLCSRALPPLLLVFA